MICRSFRVKYINAVYIYMQIFGINLRKKNILYLCNNNWMDLPAVIFAVFSVQLCKLESSFIYQVFPKLQLAWGKVGRNYYFFCVDVFLNFIYKGLCRSMLTVAKRLASSIFHLFRRQSWLLTQKV